MKNLRILFFAALAILATHVVSAQSVVIYRNNSLVSGSFTTLGSAVAAATTGDSLVLSAHTFPEHNIILNKNLILKGTINGTDTSKIDAQNGVGRRVLSVTAGDTIRLYDLIVTGGNADSGSGIWNEGCLVLSGHTTVRNNTAEWQGAGIQNFTGGFLRMEGHARVTGNSTLQTYGKGGGGIYSNGDIVIGDHSEVTENKTHFAFGAGIGSEMGNVLITGYARVSRNGAHNNTFFGSSVSAAGSLIIEKNAAITENSSGGIFSSGSLVVKDSVFICYNGRGGVIIENGTATIKDRATIKGNSGGPGIYASADYVIVQDDVVVDSNINDGTSLGGGIASLQGTIKIKDRVRLTRNASYFGGGVYIADTFLISDSVFIGDNLSWTDGGGIYLSDAIGEIKDRVNISYNRSNSYGGGILTQRTNLAILDDVTISYNKNYSIGGGLAAVSDDSSKNLTRIRGRVSFSHNSSDQGGAIFNHGHMEIEGGNFEYNSARAGAREFGRAICQIYNSLTMSGTRLYNPDSTFGLKYQISSGQCDTLRLNDCWWGTTDTSEIIYNQYSRQSPLFVNRWIKPDWKIQNANHLMTDSTVTVTATMMLNTGAWLPPNSLPMLQAKLFTSNGNFSSSLVPINNNLFTSYFTAPSAPGPVQITGVIDADTFRQFHYAVNVSVDNENIREPVTVYPNPVQTVLYLAGIDPSSVRSISLYNLSGMLPFYQVHRLVQPSITLPASLSTGNYLLEIKTNSGKSFSKMIQKL